MKEKEVKISIRISNVMYEWIRKECEKGKKTVSEAVRACIEKGMER